MQTKSKILNLKEDFIFIKTHHALVKILKNDFTNKKNSRGIIYVVRDPRDVVLSMSNHYKITIDESIDKLFEKNFCLVGKILIICMKIEKNHFLLFQAGEKIFFHGTNMFLTVQNY